jgi:hypothetical protein
MDQADQDEIRRIVFGENEVLYSKIIAVAVVSVITAVLALIALRQR